MRGPSPLPDAARRRVLGVAARVLGELESDLVPPTLRRVRTFTPARRAVAGAGPLTAALEDDVAFRHRVAAAWRADLADLAEAITAGMVPEADSEHPAEDVLAGLFLLRPPGWVELGEAARRRLAERSAARARQAVEATIVREDAAAVAERERLLGELAARRAQVAVLDQELAGLRRELRRQRSAADRDRAAARAAADQARTERAGLEAERDGALAEVDRLREELATVRARGERARQAARADRALDEGRLRLLLDSVVEAAGGLRRELALPPVTIRPADVVAQDLALEAADAPRPGVRDSAAGRSPEDPALLADLLTVPQTHLVVDGYNVTKTGWPELALADQRRRLTEGLAALAARTGVEVTCCFDGAAAVGAGGSGPLVRGVRTLFSIPPMNADELIRRLVRAEPPGRPVVVVSTDGEVAGGVRRSGAYSVASLALVRLLGRG